MSLSGIDRGTGGNATAATSLTVTPASNFAAGEMAVLCVAYDNAGSGGSDPFATISDSHGNTWTSRLNILNDPGAASAGTVLRIFETPQDVGTLTTGSSITISFGAVSVTAKVWTLQQITASVGVPQYVTGGGTTGSGTAPTVTTSSIPSGDAVIGAVAIESGTTQTETGDQDGTWSAQQVSEIGSTTSGQVITSQRKIVVSAGTSTYNPTFGISGDFAIGWIQIRENIPVTVTPSTLALTLTTFAPTVTTSNNVTVTPPTVSLVLTAFAPTVTISNNIVVTPGTQSLIISTFVPVLQIGVTPSTGSLIITGFVPNVTAGSGVTVTPLTAPLIVTTFAPAVNITIIPGTRALVLSSFAPTVTITADITVTPQTQSLFITAFAPTVQVGGNVTLIPPTKALIISTFSPTTTLSDNITVTPSVASLTVTTFAPVIISPVVVTPPTTSLTLTTFSPNLQISGGGTLIPAPVALILNTFVPNIQLTSNIKVTVPSAPLVLTTFAPNIQVIVRVTPLTLPLILTTFSPSISAGGIKIANINEILTLIESLTVEVVSITIPYVDVIGAQEYFNDRLHTEAWDYATTPEKLEALVCATQLINNLRFKGQKVSTYQINEFPRYGQSSIPKSIEEACCELALELLDGVDPNLERKSVSQASHGYSAARTTFNRGFIPSFITHGINGTTWLKLVPYLADPLEVKIGRMN